MPLVRFGPISTLHSGGKFDDKIFFPTGLDINKKGTEAGQKKIPESLGLAPGVVFLVSVPPRSE